MNDSETLARLRHDLANPLAAMLAEIQLLLLDESKLPEGVVDALRSIETQTLRMRTILRS
jgi:signal transduction histidine kinase